MTADERLGETPSRIPTADLGAAFGPPDRTSALSGQLTRPSRRQGASPPAVATPPPDAETAKSVKKVAPRRTGTPRSSDSEKPASVQLIVYLSVSLKERLRAVARADDVTYTTVVLDAVDATHHQFDELLGTGDADAPRREGSLFGVQPVAPTQPGREPHVQVSLRTLRRDLDVLDQLAQRHRVTRSALIAAALDAHLRTQ